MYTSVKYQEAQNEVVIKIQTKLSTSVIIGLILNNGLFILTLILSIAVDYQITILISPAFIIWGIVNYKYIKATLQVETIIIDVSHLTVIRSLLGIKTKKQYEKQFLRDFKPTKETLTTPHPLEDSFDSLSFGVNERIIRFLNQKGNILFKYYDRTISFGRNISEEDTNKILKLFSVY